MDLGDLEREFMMLRNKIKALEAQVKQQERINAQVKQQERRINKLEAGVEQMVINGESRDEKTVC